MANVGIRFEDYVAELLSRLGLRILAGGLRSRLMGLRLARSI
ncbi:hypothetical protein [Vulcanisaeta sp. JCM 14467]|nr:hypothetical protein [Vulcanisaeta sp. JCM 14467]